MVRRSIYLKQIGRHYERNRRVAKYAKMFLNGGRRVIIFSDYTNQLYLIKKILEGELGVLPDEVGYYTRSVRIDGKSQAVPEKERIRAAKSCKVLLATYKMLQAGTDMPEVSGIVFASPQADATQATGRIERFKEKKKQPIVVDLVDVDSELALRWAMSREEDYMRRRLSIKKIGVEQWTKQPIRKSITEKKGGSSR